MNAKKISKSTIALLLVLLVLLISMVGTSLVQSNGGSVGVSTYTGSLNDLATMIADNTKGNGKKVDIQFQHDFSTQNSQICFMTFIPKNATKANPVPCVICVHGNNNSKEMQFENYTELSKRGFVVISVDMSSEGRTDPEIDKYTKGTQGTLAATKYAMSLDCVDNTKIGMTGHSGGESTCYNTIKAINAPNSANHISAWFCSSGTMAAVSMKKQDTTDLIWGVAAGKFDEVDTSFFGTYKFLTSKTALSLMKLEDSSYDSTSIPEGKWFSSTGAIESPAEGKALGVKSAVAFWNPPYTHPMGTFSTDAAALAINFFYSAFGTPNGAPYIPATSQTWPIGTFFQLLGLLGFFALALPLVSVLLKTPVFADLKREVTAQKDLPSIKSWKEWIPLVVTFIPLLLFPYFTYFKYYDKGTALFDNMSFPMGTANGVAWWTFCSGLFCIFMIAVNYALRKLCHLNDKEPVFNPFTPGKLDGGLHFLKTIAFVATVIVLMYIPCYIAYNVFHMNFGIAVYTVGLPRMQWLPDMIFKYLPFWIVFLVPNAILNADTRFKDLPEWATVLICAVANALPIMLLTYINYSTLFSTGLLWNSSSQPGIMAYNLFAPMIFIAISGRYIYKRTGNAWSAGMINATILTFMALTLTMHNTSLMFHF